MNVSHGLDMGIKVLIIVLLIVIIIVVAVTWWNWFHDPTGFLPDPTNPSGDDLGGFIKQLNDMLKKFFGG